MTPVLPSVLYRLIAVLCSILLFTRSCAGVRAHFSYAHIRDTLLRVFFDYFSNSALSVLSQGTSISVRPK